MAIDSKISKINQELYVEIILYDVLDNIFSNLGIYDLNKAAKVCKSWYFEAEKEKLRRGPQVMILQALGNYDAIKSNDFKVIDIDDFTMSLRIKPSIGIFFTDGKYPAPDDCDSVSYEICEAHQWTRPDNCFYVAVEVLGINVDHNIIGGEKNITASVFLPLQPAVNYTITETSSHCIVQHFMKSDSLLTDICNKLFPAEKEHMCFIIFIYQWKDEPAYESYHNKFLASVLDDLKSRYNPGSYSLWGGAISDIFTMSTNDRPSYHSTSFCAMCLSGNPVESWSTFFKVNATDLDIKDKLLKLKKYVRLKSTSVAFIILPTDEDCIDRSKINIFKNIFPTISLISIFNDKSHFILSVDSMKHDQNPMFKHQNSYAFMILTFNL